MEMFALIDKSVNRVIDQFPAYNEDDARIKMTQALYGCKNPVGLDKRYLFHIGSINMENGCLTAIQPKEIVSLDILYSDLKEVRKKYGC